MIDLVSLTVEDDFFTLFNNSAMVSWVRHIANIRTITFIGRQQDYATWYQYMLDYFPNNDRKSNILTVSGIPCRWVNDSHWLDNPKYKKRYGCGSPNLCQQLIKLHVFDLKYEMNLDLLDNVLIVDSDTVWARDIEFVHDDHTVTYVAIINNSTDDETKCNRHDPIMFQERLTTGPSAFVNTSMAPFPWCDRSQVGEDVHVVESKTREDGFIVGERHIAHHMLFQRDVMEHLHQSIQMLWGTDTLWHALVKCFKGNYGCNSRVAEYELYFSWVYHQFRERLQVEYFTQGNSFMGGSSICNRQEMECCQRQNVLLKGCHDHRVKFWPESDDPGDMCCMGAAKYGI